jgi:resuscitation-promoting factor RpfB
MTKLLALLVLATAACTPAELQAWDQWHQVDPQPAEDHARAVFGPRARPVTRPERAVGASVWDALAACEAGGNWHIATGNGYFGGLQFSLRSWRAVGGTGLPNQASRETQIEMGRRLQAIQGWGAWPTCSRKLGLR